MADEGERKKKRSNAIILTVMGVAATVWIADELIPEPVEMRRNTYADRAACERDYPPEKCEPQTTGTTTGTSYVGYHGGYWGPYYSASRTSVAPSDPGPGRTNGLARASFTTSYRGGFGAVGRAIHGVS
jgi:hypothetical protein